MKHLKYFENIKKDYILYHPKIGDWVYLNTKFFMSSLAGFIDETPCKIIDVKLNDDPNSEYLYNITCKFMEHPIIKDGIMKLNEVIIYRKLNKTEIEEYLMNLTVKIYNL